jgi:hypothetical protein
MPWTRPWILTNWRRRQRSRWGLACAAGEAGAQPGGTTTNLWLWECMIAAAHCTHPACGFSPAADRQDFAGGGGRDAEPNGGSSAAAEAGGRSWRQARAGLLQPARGRDHASLLSRLHCHALPCRRHHSKQQGRRRWKTCRRGWRPSEAEHPGTWVFRLSVPHPMLVCSVVSCSRLHPLFELDETHVHALSTCNHALLSVIIPFRPK